MYSINKIVYNIINKRFKGAWDYMDSFLDFSIIALITTLAIKYLEKKI